MQTPFLSAVLLRGENGMAQIPIELEDVSKYKIVIAFYRNKI